MGIHLRHVVIVLLLTGLMGAPPPANAQPGPYNLKYNSGQTVQPIFEGWSRNADGSFTMHFGYLNRNWVEQVHVAVGPENRFEPGDVDAGQPTFFYPRVHRRMFSVPVPADFGDQRLTWHLTVRGETLRASGWLEPTWEIDPVHGGRSLNEEEARNTAPTLDIDVSSAAVAGEAVTLAAAVTDDGLPTPRDPEAAAARPIGQESPPTLQAPPEAPEAPINVPAVSARREAPEVRGLRVSWMVWRGPSGVEFEPATTIAVTEGHAVATATFTEPGRYLLRAEVSDGRLTAEKLVSVLVEPR